MMIKKEGYALVLIEYFNNEYTSRQDFYDREYYFRGGEILKRDGNKILVFAPVKKKSIDEVLSSVGTAREFDKLELSKLIDRMRAKADNAYVDYINQMRSDECLGWEIKIERQKFGEAELKAHCASAEKLGRHRALHEITKMLEDILSPH